MAITQPLRLWHLTSLDAPTVAVTWLLAFAWSAHMYLPIWLPITLALITWSTYITDRLLDAWKAFQPHQPTRVPQVSLLRPGITTLRPRHLLHWQYRKLFLPTAITSVLVALILIHQNMPPAARERNTILAAATLAYFTGVHNPWRSPTSRLKLPKELLVAILFTLACTLPTLTRLNSNQLSLLPPILAFTALAWLNCQSIESWESRTPTKILPIALTLAASTLLTAALTQHHPRITLLLLTASISAALLALLDYLAHQKQNLHPTTLRALADLVLLTPAALLLLGR